MFSNVSSESYSEFVFELTHWFRRADLGADVTLTSHENGSLVQGRKEGVSFNNTHQLDTRHSHFLFIKNQTLDMLRKSLAHHQEALHEHSLYLGV
jgi:hypothetical protein